MSELEGTEKKETVAPAPVGATDASAPKAAEPQGQLVETDEQTLATLLTSLQQSFDADVSLPADEEASMLHATASEKLAAVVKDPSLIDGLSSYDAHEVMEEVNRVFCGGMYHYCLPNGKYDYRGVKIEGTGDYGSKWDDKAALHQMCQDVQWMQAAQKGTEELYKLLNGQFGARLGLSGEEWGKLSLQERADRIVAAGAVSTKAKWSAQFNAFWNSWDGSTRGEKEYDAPTEFTLPGELPPLRFTETEEHKKASGGLLDYDSGDVIAVNPKNGKSLNRTWHYGKRQGGWFAPDENMQWSFLNPTFEYEGETYKLVMEERGVKLLNPYFKSDSGKVIKGRVQGRDVGLSPFYKLKLYDPNNKIHESAVRQAMRTVGAESMNDFGKMVYESKGRVMVINDDVFYSQLSRDGNYVISVGDGGRTEYAMNVVKEYEDQFVNQRNAMNAMVVREIFNENPDVLKWYNRYMATVDDNLMHTIGMGRLDRRGDWDAILTEFCDEYKDVCRPDAELTPEELAKKKHYEKTFAQFVDVLGLTDHREGFGYFGTKWLDWLPGAGNVGLEFVNETYNLFADGLSFYRHLFDPEDSEFDMFKTWAREDLKTATATQFYDQGTGIGLIGGEAGKLLAFSAVMKVGTAGRFLEYTGKTVNATGRGMKAVGMVKAGQKLKSVGQRVIDAGRKIGGGEKLIANGVTRVEAVNGKLPKGAFKVGEEWFVHNKTKVQVGNFLQEYNKGVEKARAELQRSLETAKASAAAATGKIGMDEAAVGKLYESIEGIERQIAATLGKEHGAVSQWCLDIANELPALTITAGAMAQHHKASAYYQIGQGFVERDKDGKVTGLKVEKAPLEIAEKYAVYDGLGNTVFMLHLPKIMQDVIGGRAGSKKLQTAARGWYGKVMEAAQSGNYNRANALVAMYENAFRRLAVGAMKGGAVGTGMTLSSTMVGNAEQIALAEQRGEDTSDMSVLPTPEQGVESVKSGLLMAAGMVMTGGISGMLREAFGGFKDKAQLVTQMKQFVDANTDLWARLAAHAHANAGKGVDVTKMGDNPAEMTRRAREEVRRREDAFREVAADTDDFIARAVDAEATGEGRKEVRNEMVAKYGEEFARVLDNVVDYVKHVPELAERFVEKYAGKRLGEEYGKTGAFSEFGFEEVAHGLENLLGIKIRRPKKNGDGTYRFAIDVGGKEGWLSLDYRSENLDATARTKNDDGTYTYAKGIAEDLFNGLSGADESFGSDEYKPLREEFEKLDDGQKAKLRNGEDVNGILTRTLEIANKRGGGIKGVFVNTPEYGESGKPIGTKKVAVMNENSGALAIEDFAHETAHGIVAQLRDMGFFKKEVTGEDGKKSTVDLEEDLRKLYGDTGEDPTAWEELFVKDLLGGRFNKEIERFRDEGLAKLAAHGHNVRNLARAIGKSVRDFFKKKPKPVKSEVEKAIETRLEDAKRLIDEEREAAKAEEIKLSADEAEAGEKPDVGEEPTPEEAETPPPETGASIVGGALVLSRNPIPNSLMMDGVKPEDVEARKKELNASGFYYDGQHDMWVNEHSAPTLYHRAVNEAIATKVKTEGERRAEAFKLWQDAQADIAAAMDFAEKQGLSKEEVEAVKKKATEERRRRIMELVTPEEFTEDELRHLGIVVTKDGEPVGVVSSENSFVTDGMNVMTAKELPSGCRIVPYQHDLYGRWAVRGGNRDLSAGHNCSAQSLLTILTKKGGVPGLSFAMFASDKGHTRFGPISVLVRRPSIDPKTKYPKTPEGRKQKNYLYKENVGTPDVHDFEQVESGGNEYEKAVEAVNQFEQYIFHGTPMDEGIRAHEYERGAYWLRATNVDAARKERENAQYSGAPHPAKYDLFATEADIYDENGELRDPAVPFVNPYWEAKLGRGLAPSEIGAVVIPRFSQAAIEGAADVKAEVIDEAAVMMAAERSGLDPQVALKRVYEMYQKNPESVRSVLKPFSSNALVDTLEAIKSECSKQGIPVYEYDVDDVESMRQALQSPLQNISVKGQEEATRRALDEVQGLRFGVIGERGAISYFAGAYNNVLEDIRATIREAAEAVDEGTRKGLVSSRNAEVNKRLQESGNRFGPFAVHVGGADGDRGIRLEYAERKPKIPPDFIKRVKDGEIFHLFDILGNPVRQDEVFAKAYPDLMNKRIWFRDSKLTAENRIKEPAWREDSNDFVLVNEDGEIVVDMKRWDARRAPEQFARAAVALVQKKEGWQERVTQSEGRVAESLAPERKKRAGSELTFRLVDPRLILGDRIGPLVEGAVKKHFEGRREVDDALIRKISDTVLESIRSSVNDFAGEAEARFLASRFGMGIDELMDYSAAEKAFKDVLFAYGEGTTSAEQTKKNLAYWDNVIMKAVDTALYGRNAGKDGRNASLRPEFRDAIADEITNTIVRNIAAGSRVARTDTEARLAGLESRGETGRPKDSADLAVDSRAFENGQVTMKVAPSIGESLGTGLDTVMEGVSTIDAKWEKNKGSVAAEIRKELEAVRKTVRADMSKAKSEQERLMKRVRKLIDDNSTTTDPIVKEAFFDEALKMAQESGSRYSVVGQRRTPKQLVTVAAAAKLAKNRVSGHSNDEATKRWLKDEATRIGIPESQLDQFVNSVFADASSIALQVASKARPSTRAEDLVRMAEDGVARREFVKRVMGGWSRGYNVGAAGERASWMARAEANRIRTRMAKDARGLAMAELNSLFGGDIIKDIVSFRDTYGSGDAFGVAMIEKFSRWMLANDGRFAGMSMAEFEQSPVARAELAHTVSAWLRETARQLDYGQTREWAMREAARLNKQPVTFGQIHMTVAKHAEHIADAIDNQNVDRLLDDIDRQIDTFADGDKAVAQSVPDYQRKIAPRLQEYWGYVKKAMRMTEDAVEKEVNRLNTIMNLTDEQLQNLAAKGADDVAAAEDGLKQREDAMMKLNAMMRYGSMKYKNYGECMSLFNGQMANELAGQVQRHMVMRQQRLAQDAAVRQAFIGELTSIRRSKRGEFDASDNGTLGGNFLAFSVADLFKRMQLYLHEGSDAWNFIDTFRQDMSLGHIDQTVFISRWEGQMRQAVKQIFGANFERVVEDWMVKNPDYARFSRSGWTIPENAQTAEVWVNGRKKVVRLAENTNAKSPTNLPSQLSKANLLYIYAACQQADMQANNVIWGRDAKYMRDIEAIIGPEGVQMAQWLTKAYSEIRTTLDPISREISGMPVLSPDERYCPLSFIQDKVSNDSRKFTSSPFPAFLTRRVTHDTLRLNETADAFRMFEDKIQDSGHYIGFARIIDRMNSTLKHPKVQTAFAQLYGTKAKNDIYAQLADALNGGRKNADTLLTGARNFVTASSLFCNVGSAMKQLEGIGGWAVEMGLGPWLKGLVKNPVTSAEVRQGVRELIDAGLFVTRSEEGISEAMVSLMNSCDGVPSGPMSRTYRWYKRHGMDITKIVDRIASMSMAGQYYTGRKNWYIENGLREEDAKRRALADTDYAIQTTQQSGRSEFLHSAQRGGTAGKMLTQFSGPAFVRWGIECASWHRAFVMGDRGAFKKLLSRMVALHLICPSVLSLAGGISMMMFKRDDQKMKDIVERTEKDIVVNCLTGPMSGWFIYGQIINAFAYENVMARTKSASMKTHYEAPVLSKLHSLQQATTKLVQDVFKSAPWDSFDDAFNRHVREDALKIFELIFPASRIRHPLKNAVKAVEKNM